MCAEAHKPATAKDSAGAAVSRHRQAQVVTNLWSKTRKFILLSALSHCTGPRWLMLASALAAHPSFEKSDNVIPKMRHATDWLGQAMRALRHNRRNGPVNAALQLVRSQC